jgi:hypothetical protein
MDNNINYFIIFLLVLCILIFIYTYYYNFLEKFEIDIDNPHNYYNDNLDMLIKNKVNTQLYDSLNNSRNADNEKLQKISNKKEILKKNLYTLNKDNNSNLHNEIYNIENKYNERRDEIYRLLNQEQCPIYNYKQINNNLQYSSLQKNLTKYIDNMIKDNKSIKLINYNNSKKHIITLYKHTKFKNRRQMIVNTGVPFDDEYYIEISHNNYLNYDEPINCSEYKKLCMTQGDSPNMYFNLIKSDIEDDPSVYIVPALYRSYGLSLHTKETTICTNITDETQCNSNNYCEFKNNICNNNFEHYCDNLKYELVNNNTVFYISPINSNCEQKNINQLFTII